MPPAAPPQPRRFDVVLFDLGSTLMYFDGQWADISPLADEALYHALLEAGLSLERGRFLQDFSSRMRQYISERDTEFIEYTTAYVLRSLLSEYGYHDLPDSLVLPALKERYAITQAHWKAEADAGPTLEALQGRGLRMGLISNASDDTDVQTLVDKTGLRDYFEAIITSASLGIRKPNPRIFEIMLERLDIPANRAVMVGDSLGADILGARNAGIYSVWITRRADTPANRSHVETVFPDARIHSLAELLPIVDMENG